MTADRPPGQIIDERFKLIRKLTEGGMGAVYLAQQLSIERDVVIKFVRQDLAMDPQSPRRFEREAQLISQLHHPNIVTVYSFGACADGTPYLAMEYVDGLCLTDVLRQSDPLPLKRALSVTDQILGALQEAHRLGIIHRDLKPDNVMLSRTADGGEHVKILDFGVAKLIEDSAKESALTQQGAILGTPRYMSPEQINDLPLDARSDLYAVGLILYEMLTSHHPIRAETPMQFLIGHLQQEIPPLRELSPDRVLPHDVEPLVLKALKKERRDRFGSAREMQLALRVLLHGAPPGEKPPPRRTLIASTPNEYVTLEPNSEYSETPPPFPAASEASSGSTPRQPAPSIDQMVAPSLSASDPSTAPSQTGDQEPSRATAEVEGASTSSVEASTFLHRWAPTIIGGLLLLVAVLFVSRSQAPAPAPPRALEANTRLDPLSQSPEQLPPGERGADDVKKAFNITSPPTPSTSTPALIQAKSAAAEKMNSKNDSMYPPYYDPNAFGGDHYPQALALAQELEPDAGLTSLIAFRVAPNGFMLPDGYYPLLIYTFRSPARSLPTAKHPIGTYRPCEINVNYGAQWLRRTLSRDDACDDPVLPPPDCSLREVWARARARGAPQGYYVTDMIYKKNRWLLTIRDETYFIPDDCSPPSEAKRATKARAAAALATSSPERLHEVPGYDPQTLTFSDAVSIGQTRLIEAYPRASLERIHARRVDADGLLSAATSQSPMLTLELCDREGGTREIALRPDWQVLRRAASPPPCDPDKRLPPPRCRANQVIRRARLERGFDSGAHVSLSFEQSSDGEPIWLLSPPSGEQWAYPDDCLPLN